MSVLRPVRFTDDVGAMRELLENIGLRPRIESDRGGWVDMVAGSGMAALHSAAASASGGRPGETRLSYEADDVDALAEHLKASGYDDSTVWDEAYGRVLSVTAPDGGRLWIDERSTDLYGYHEHPAEADPRITVRAGPLLGRCPSLAAIRSRYRWPSADDPPGGRGSRHRRRTRGGATRLPDRRAARRPGADRSGRSAGPHPGFAMITRTGELWLDVTTIDLNRG